jgi:hypothetical protein
VCSPWGSSTRRRNAARSRQFLLALVEPREQDAGLADVHAEVGGHSVVVVGELKLLSVPVSGWGGSRCS